MSGVVSIGDCCSYPILPRKISPTLHRLDGGNLNVIAGPLLDIQNFAGTNTVDWLIRMAKLILDPRGDGVLYTFQTGTVQYWLNREMTDSWRQVAAGTCRPSTSTVD